MASRTGCDPMLDEPAVHTSGNTLALSVAFFSPVTSSSCVSVPASKNFSISCSSASATISISASRAALARSVISPGTAPSVILPEPSVAKVYAFIATRSTTPLKLLSSPRGSWIGTIARPQVSRSDSSERSSEARSRSRRLSTTIRGSESSCAAAQAFSVCTSTPATASTTSSVPSATRLAGGHAHRRARVAEEVAEARGVDEVDLGLAELGVGETGRQRVLPGDFLFVVVGDGVALVHLAEAVHHAGGEQERRDQLRLAAPSVADDGDVPDVGGLVNLHSGILPAGVIRTLQGASYLAPSALATAASLRARGNGRLRCARRGRPPSAGRPCSLRSLGRVVAGRRSRSPIPRGKPRGRSRRARRAGRSRARSARPIRTSALQSDRA